MIKNISNTDINRLTSGQVIIDLKSIVKELVENSIDANSKKLEITFKNYGVDLLSVVDDGDGICSDDFESLCLRSHTSKLLKFKDLDSLQSLGFRGEALNSICSVSHQVKITTSTKNEYPKVHEIEYDSMGMIKKCQRKVGGLSNNGTSVTIDNLFFNLPVRHKNFKKNSRKEFHKAIHFLINYLIIYPEIKFSVFNFTTKKNLVLNSPGGSKTTILDNMLTIFGANGSRGLSPISLDVNADFKIEGYVSNHSFGLGRSVQDRQYLFVNKRPILQKRLQKIVNDTFRQFNHLQYPVFIFNLKVNPIHLDVNLTPDKTLIGMHNEVELLECIRSKLASHFETQDSIVPKNNNQNISRDEDQLSRDSFSNSKKAHIHTNEVDMSIDKHLMNNEKLSRDPRNKTVEYTTKGVTAEQILSLHSQSKPEDSFGFTEKPSAPSAGTQYSIDESEKEETELETSLLKSNQTHESRDLDSNEEHQKDEIEKPNIHSSRNTAVLDELTLIHENNHPSSRQNDNEAQSNAPVQWTEQSTPLPLKGFTVREWPETPSSVKDDLRRNYMEDSYCDTEPDPYGKNFHPVIHEDSMEISIGDQAFYERPSKRQKRRALIHNIACAMKTDGIHYKTTIPKSNFKGKHSNKIIIDNIDSSREQEQKLSYIISKKDFLKMKLIGQFNLGFILVSLNDHNLFIIDQHASDEKYNFEKLNRDFQIKYQRLIAPKKVELSIIDEMLVIENKEIFQNNGFTFETDFENQKPGSRIKLISLPILKDKIFDISDFHELINLIALNSSNKHVKCSKTRSILAMRACRSSIMIGQTLTKSKMNEVVKNLTDLDKPWNCPHGRPTLRHLIELDGWKENLQDYNLKEDFV